MKQTSLIWFLVVMFLLATRATSYETNITPLDNLLYQVGRCESGNNQNVRPGDNGLAHGKFQFHTGTFKWMEKKSGMSGLDINSERDQTRLARWAFEHGHCSHWTCYKKVKVQNDFWKQNHRVKHLAKAHKTDKHIALLLKDNPEKVSGNLLVWAKPNPEKRDLLKISFI